MSTTRTELDVLKQYAERITQAISSFPDEKKISDSSWIAILNVKHVYEHDREELLQVARSLDITEDEIISALEVADVFDFLVKHPTELLDKFGEQCKTHLKDELKRGEVRLSSEAQVVLFQYLLPGDVAQLESLKRWADRFIGKDGGKEMGLLHHTHFFFDAINEARRLDNFARLAVNTKMSGKVKKDISTEQAVKMLQKLATIRADNDLLEEPLFFAEIPSDLEKVEELWLRFQAKKEEERILLQKQLEEKEKEKKKEQKSAMLSSDSQMMLTLLKVKKSQSKKDLTQLAQDLNLKEKKEEVDIDAIVGLLELEFTRNLAPQCAGGSLDQFALLWTASACCMLYKNYLASKIEEYVKSVNPTFNISHIRVVVDLQKDSIYISYKREMLRLLAKFEKNFGLLIEKYAHAEMLRQYFNNLLEQIKKGAVLDERALIKVQEICKATEGTFLKARPDGWGIASYLQSKVGVRPRSECFTLSLARLFQGAPAEQLDADDSSVELDQFDSPEYYLSQPW